MIGSSPGLHTLSLLLLELLLLRLRNRSPSHGRREERAKEAGSRLTKKTGKLKLAESNIFLVHLDVGEVKHLDEEDAASYARNRKQHRGDKYELQQKQLGEGAHNFLGLANT